MFTLRSLRGGPSPPGPRNASGQRRRGSAVGRCGCVQEAGDPASWEIWPAPKGHREVLYQRFPEFTCLCPRSGFPDFALIKVRYQPAEWIVELRSLKLYINGLLLSLSEMLQGENPTLNPSLSSSYRAVDLFLASIGERLSEEWSLDSMANACGLGRSRFSEHCNQLTNMSPSEFLSKRRIAAAMDLLCQRPDLSITDVAFRVGFNSSQYFATYDRQFSDATRWRRYRQSRRLSSVEYRQIQPASG